MSRFLASALLLLAPNLISSQVSTNPKDYIDYVAPTKFLHDLKLFRVDTSTFSYDDPQLWGQRNPTCNGPYQSPINIDPKNMEYRQLRKSLKWHNMEKMPNRMNLEKSEIVLGMEPEWSSDRDRPYLTGGPLNESYYFYNMHFHWNTATNAGSEHAVFGKRFPMELHVVYTSNPEGVITEGDRILVTGFMISVGDTYNEGFEPIISALSKRSGPPGKDIPIAPFPLKQLGVTFCADYVIYSGSLTTPPCTQGVTWIISSQRISVSDRQYNHLMRSLEGPGGSPTYNNRPLQRLNGRRVYYVVPPPCPSPHRTVAGHPHGSQMVKVQVSSG